MEEIKYYAVTAKCGHVGKGKYIEVTFAIEATSGKEAAKIGRMMPRVKRDHPQAIISVERINLEEYIELANSNAENPYLQCKNKQEQNAACPELYKEVKELYQIIDYSEKREARLTYLFKKRKLFDDMSIHNSYQLCSC